jgi:hypothetical protein
VVLCNSPLGHRGGSRPWGHEPPLSPIPSRRLPSPIADPVQIARIDIRDTNDWAASSMSVGMPSGVHG